MPTRVRRRFVLLLGAALLLAVAGRARAATGSSIQHPDSLTATEIAFSFRYGHVSPTAVPPSEDRWVARDKATHVIFSGLWTVSTQYLLVQKADWSEGDALPASIASAAAVGLAKEAYDASHVNGTASHKDLVADALGIGLAVGVILL